MTEEEILAQLRDIHFPAQAGAEAAMSFALWPFLVLGGAIALMLILRLVGRNRWRRAERRDLARITAVADPAAQWQMLLGFASTLSDRTGRPCTLPEVAFRRPETIGEAERTALVRHLQAELAR